MDPTVSPTVTPPMPPACRRGEAWRSARALLGIPLCALLALAPNAAEPPSREPGRTVAHPGRAVRGRGVKVTLEAMRRFDAALGRTAPKAEVEQLEETPGPRPVPGATLGGPAGVMKMPPAGSQPRGPGAGGAPPPAKKRAPGTLTVTEETPALLSSYPGMAYDRTLYPPDTMGAAGPSHFFSVLNFGVTAFDKATGAPAFGPISHQAFWAALGTGQNDPASFPFDPRVLFDQYSGRFIVIADGGANGAPNATPSWVLLAVSNDADPTHGFIQFALRFDTPAEIEWADFPGLGVDQDHIYVTNNAYSVGGHQFTKARFLVVDKAPAFAGNLVASEFRDTLGGFAWRPAHAFGPGEVNYIVSQGWTAGETTRFLEIQEFSFNGGSPALTDLGFVQVADYGFDVGTISEGIINSAPQGGCTARIGVVQPHLGNAVLRDGRLWITHPVDDPVTDLVARAEVAWYEVDPWQAAHSAPFAPPLQQGRVSDPDRWYWVPSIAVNAQGTVGLGFSGSSATEFPSTYFTLRERNDPPGTMRPLASLHAGESPYILGGGALGISRWGDYSATSIDPVDGITFWTVQEYAKQEEPPGCPRNGTGVFGTWIGSFRTEAALAPPAPSGCSAVETGGAAGWKPYPAIPSAYEGAAGVAIGDRFYVTHGWSALRGMTADTNIYDRTHGAWGTGAPAPAPRADLAGVCIQDAAGQGLVFAVGGRAPGPLRDVEIYDPVTGAWSAGPPMPTARHSLGAAFVPGTGVAGGSLGSVYVMGGSDGAAPRTGNALAVNEAYDVQLGVWMARAPMPIPMMEVASVFLPQKGRIYVVGGFDGTAVSPALQIYDPAADRWTQGPPMPTARSGLTAGVCGSRLHAIGGAGASGALDVNESFNPFAGAWFGGGAPLPTRSARAAAQSLSTGSEIAVIGSAPASSGFDAPIHEVFTCGSPPVCAADGDCDDWIVCDGAEKCLTASGRCLPGPAPACNDDSACTADACPAATDVYRVGFASAGGSGWTHASRGGADTWHVATSGCLGLLFPDPVFLSNGNAGASCQISSSMEESQLLSPPVALPPSSNLVLSFDAFSNDSGGACTRFAQPDAKDVGITADGGATYTILNDCFPLTDGGGTPVHRRFDISAFAGQTVQVIFVYDTQDAAYGIAFGVDGVAITAGDACVHTALPDGASCSDALFCNGAETCLSGACGAGAPPDCGDGDPCTADACSEGLGGCASSAALDSERAAGADGACGGADDNVDLFGPDGLCGTADDGSGDGLCDLMDNCPAAYNPAQADTDGDGRGDGCECRPADAQLWSAPGEAKGVIFTSSQTLSWSAPSMPGGVAVSYDTIRSESRSDFGAGAVCVESDDGQDTTGTDPASPPVRKAFYYLVRARNACGAGTLGAMTGGAERPGRACP